MSLLGEATTFQFLRRANGIPLVLGLFGLHFSRSESGNIHCRYTARMLPLPSRVPGVGSNDDLQKPYGS